MSRTNTIYNDRIATTFCNAHEHRPPPFWFSVCHPRQGNQTSARWVNYGACMRLPTPPPPSTPTTATSTVPTEQTTLRTTTTTSQPPSITYRMFPALDPDVSREQGVLQWMDANHSWFIAVVVAVSLLVQVAVPLAVWLCGVVRVCRMERALSEGVKANPDVQLTLHSVQDRLGAFLEAHPEPEEHYSDATRAELTDIQKQYTAAEICRAEFKNHELLVALKTPSFCRICSLCFYCSVWAWLLFALLCETLELTRRSQVIHTLVVVAHLVILALYACVLVETYRSRERRHLIKLAAAKTRGKALEELRALQPEMLMSAKCWHWETKTYHTSRSTGGGYHSTKTRDGKVVSAHIVEPMAFSRWLDVSDTQGVVCGGLINKVRVYTVVVPGDSDTQAYVDQQYQDFCNTHRDKDHTVELSLVRGVMGAPRQAIVLADHAARPWWVSQAAFWAFSVLGLTWPYRCVLHRHTSSTHVVLVKRLYASVPHSPLVQEASSPFDTTHLLPPDGTASTNDVSLVAMNLELPTSDLDTSSEYSREEGEHRL